MIKAKLGHRLDGWVHAALPFLFHRPVNPNLLTVAGALVSLVAAVAFAQGSFLAAGIFVLMSGFFDMIDGVVARHHGVSSCFGAFLDSTLDRLVDMVLLLGIAMHFAQTGRSGGVLLAGITLVAAVLVSYSKACAERFVPQITVGVFERGERVLILAAGAIFDLLVPALWIIAIGSTITVIQRFACAYREMEQIDADERVGLGGRV